MSFQVKSFSSYEELMAEQQSLEADANAHIADKQREVVWGSYFFRLEGNIAIFGYVTSLEEMITDRDKLDPDSEEYQEASYEISSLQESYSRNYRYGPHYSDVVPDGEWGSSHLVSIWPITEWDFAYAKSNGWKMSPETAVRIRCELIETGI